MTILLNVCSKLRIICKASLGRIYSSFLSDPQTIFGELTSHSRVMSMTTTMAVGQESKLFQGKIDRFKGVSVDSKEETCNDVMEFSQILGDSLKHWKEIGNRGIWFKVHLNQSEWVPVLVKNGFKFHHAKEEYVMMYLWLPKTENCNIPQYAHTMIGVGAVVVNEKDQILVVSEKYYVVDKPHWKLPGGYVEPGENLVDAAIREVYEETKISTEFQSILTLRHIHNGMFGCSDIYTVVSLKPLTQEIEKCDREIENCIWMDVQEYLNHPHVHDLNRFYVQKYLEYKKCNIKVNCFHGCHQIVNKPYTVYSVTKADEEGPKENGENSTS
ncbi:unnamed protein product [Phaedon cochleariae]|uniref:Nudix hydrolase domain-containing protein n=1 Tax=Phaedon cochleariae TaxID=80249 RepID=A0A9P0DLF1_PHACE|nr:unnamed protein product [Phaedon cochleariae]